VDRCPTCGAAVAELRRKAMVNPSRWEACEAVAEALEAICPVRFHQSEPVELCVICGRTRSERCDTWDGIHAHFKLAGGRVTDPHNPTSRPRADDEGER
jgi:hypothetical protein